MSKLNAYKSKRKFSSTPEPGGRVVTNKKNRLEFVVQKHDASHLHYDFRLEVGGVMKSWAIPKGPSLEPVSKRLAMLVEDHPMEYRKFEGIIPKGNYGAGTVMIWDRGLYVPTHKQKGESDEQAMERSFNEGDVKFVLAGKRLKGEFALIRLKNSKNGNEWLLIKKNDEFATEEDILLEEKSVVSDRTLEEIAEESPDKNDVWYSGNELSLPHQAVKEEKFPKGLIPMNATLTDKPFNSDDWFFEIKWDGYRTIAQINYNQTDLVSRNGKLFNKKFPTLNKALAELGIQAVLDGEVCVLDKDGKPDFQYIQNYQKNKEGTLVYYVFDLLYYNGYSLLNVPLYKRKELLKKVIPKSHDLIRISDHVEGQGVELFKLAKKMSLEGIVAKDKFSSYLPGARGDKWLKFKNICKQEVLLAGYTDPKGGRKKFGALVLAVYQNKELKYIGHVGTGFDDKTLNELYQKMQPLVIDKSPFDSNVDLKHVTWIEPVLVAEVKFQEWTSDGLLRQAVFLGLRNDKSAEEVVKEITDKENTTNEKTKRRTKTKIKSEKSNSKSEAQQKKNRGGTGGSNEERRGAEGSEVKNTKKTLVTKSKDIFLASTKHRKNVNSSGRLLLDYQDSKHNNAEVKIDKHPLKLTNLTKLFWPDEGYSKGDLIEYYAKISDYILPYLIDRPQSLRRNPNGWKESFFQKDTPDYFPDWIERTEIYSESNDKNINYLLCSDKATLIYMANLGCIEINPWFSRINTINKPDYIAIDLDPLEIEFEGVIETALAVKEVLDKAKIKGYCKTSGASGMHIYIPLGAKYNYEQGLKFAEIIAHKTHEIVPKLTSLERMPSKRKNKVYLDYLQNRTGQTLAAPYCVRPKPGATVSTPLEWDEVNLGVHPSQFTIHTIFDRLKSKGDLFEDVLKVETDIVKSLELLS